jgi:hypothetical protein
MVYLNQKEREALAQQLSEMKFWRAAGKVRGLDQKSRLAFFRNAQGVGRLMTRYDLPTKGARVTLVEQSQNVEKNSKLKAQYELLEVIVEPLPGNMT